MISYSSPDLTQHPPRSPRVRLGGYVHLPRLLDKARAFAAGKNGEYNFNCGLDQRFLGFVGIDAGAFLAAVKTGKGDVAMLAWVNEHARPQRLAWEIQAWSRWLENLGPGDAKRHAGFAEDIGALSPGNEDIRTNFDRLDLDDYVSFGGKA
jgi:hypothetical protein